MTKITISSSLPITDLSVIKFLHTELGWALSSAKKILSLGEMGFFYTCQLFLNDHIQKEKEIRKIISFFQSKKIPLTILEIDGDDCWPEINEKNIAKMKITEQQMINLLNTSKGRYL